MIDDPQWPVSWGRKGKVKPIIIRFEPIIPLGIGALCLFMASWTLVPFLLGMGDNTSNEPDFFVGIMLVCAVLSVAVYLVFCAPRLVITAAGIHLPGKRAFYSWKQVRGIYAGHDEFNLTRPVIHLKQAPRTPEPCFVFDVDTPPNAAPDNPAAPISFAPPQQNGTRRYRINLDYTFKTPKGLLKAIEQQKMAQSDA